jgi:hypothetical protein
MSNTSPSFVATPLTDSPETKPKGSTRRAFLGHVGGVAAATIASTAVITSPLTTSAAAGQQNAAADLATNAALASGLSPVSAPASALHKRS